MPGMRRRMGGWAAEYTPPVIIVPARTTPAPPALTLMPPTASKPMLGPPPSLQRPPRRPLRGKFPYSCPQIPPTIPALPAPPASLPAAAARGVAMCLLGQPHAEASPRQPQARERPCSYLPKGKRAPIFNLSWHWALARPAALLISPRPTRPIPSPSPSSSPPPLPRVSLCGA